MIALTLRGRDALMARLQAIPARANDGLARAVAQLGVELQRRVQAKLGGDVLQARTGALQASIALAADDDAGATGIGARLGSDAPYAAIQEFGGQTQAHEIRARKASALAFMLGGKMVFAKSVQHPGSLIPARSFLRSALDEMAPDIAEAMAAAVTEAIGP